MTHSFLVDAQRPTALARWLVERGHPAERVFDTGLAEAPDSRIREEAKGKNAVIVTKD